MRFEIFSKNYEMVNTHNAKSHYKMELNQFADLESHEYQNEIIFNGDEGFDELRNADIMHGNAAMLGELLPNVDWRTTDKLTTVTNQGKCGASYAFAAAASIESANAILNNIPASKTAASVQYIMDCDITNSGCRGGWATRTFTNVANNGYVMPSAYAYQYQGVQRSCIKPAVRDI
jgi:C1A family cysteine protease